MKVLTIAWTNLRRTLRERISLFFVFVFPMLMILVLGLAFGGSFRPRVGVTILDPGPLARRLAAQISAVDVITVRTVPAESDLVAMVEHGQLEAGLVIPADYGATVDAGGTVSVRYVAQNGRQGQQVGAIVEGALAQESGRLRAARFAAANSGTPFSTALARVDALATGLPAVTVDTRTTGNATFPADLGRFDVGASSELLLFVFLTAMTSSVALIETRRLGISRRMLATPTRAGHIVLGEALGRLLVALFQGLVIMLGSAVLFHVNWGDPVAAVALMVSFGLVAAGAGMLMAAVLRTGQQAIAVGLLLSLGFAALGGTMMPLDFFSPTMRTVAHLTPHAWAVDGFATLVRHHGTLASILPQISVLLGTAAVLLALASVRLRRSIGG
jgi:linearmycin/streptolysin S transport system permease protein